MSIFLHQTMHFHPSAPRYMPSSTLAAMRKVYFWGGMAATEAQSDINDINPFFVKDFKRLDKKLSSW